MDDDSRASTSTPGGSGPSSATPNGKVVRPASSRKSHRKTRTGCKTCKARKIKCDENKPSCNNCIKHSVHCDFVANTSSHSERRHEYSNHPSPLPNATSGAQLPSFERFTADTLNSHQPRALQVQDLELLHNFTVHTAVTLHNDTLVQTLMRTKLPQLGLQYEFLMRGIMALSALHLATYRPEQFDYYVAQASYHQEIALREASALLSSITEENCSALYIFSVLTFYSSLAKPKLGDDFFFMSSNGPADWLFLIRGTKSILEASYDTLVKGPFGPLFTGGAKRHELRVELASKPRDTHDCLGELQQLVEREVRDPGELEIYHVAIESLRQTFIMAEVAPGFETGDIFIWIYRVSHDFLDLVRAQKPEALCLLAYFCVLLKMLEPYWWVKGWAVHLISKIHDNLDGNHRPWIQWPIEQVGWIPH